MTTHNTQDLAAIIAQLQSQISAMENIAAVMGTGEAQPAETCKHGSMLWREGTKNNKAWGGYFCSVVNHQGGEPKCPTVWYSLTSTGKFEPQKAWA